MWLHQSKFEDDVGKLASISVRRWTNIDNTTEIKKNVDQSGAQEWNKCSPGSAGIFIITMSL